MWQDRHRVKSLNINTVFGAFSKSCIRDGCEIIDNEPLLALSKGFHLIYSSLKKFYE